MADKLDPKELAEQYGFAYKLFTSDPQLKKLLQQATKGEWTAEKFQAKLRDTKWWKSKSDAERKYLALTLGDPATAKQNYNEQLTRIRQLSEQLGLTYSKSKDKIATAALNVVSKGWSDEQVRYYLGSYISFDAKHGFAPGGEGEAAYDTLHQLAYNYGVKLDEKWAQDQSRNLVRGLTTKEDLQTALRNKAIASYPMYKEQLNAGQSMTDIAAPYMQQMAQTLELAPGSINLFDPTIKSALTSKGRDGKPTAMPLWQFENNLRQDSRWTKTQNAQDSTLQIAHKVLNDWGFTY